MNRLNRLLNLSLVGLLLSFPATAIAAPQIIMGAQARGESGSIPTIKVALNVGLPIKMPQGWRIYKGWLDNNTLAEVDGDRPFEQGATVIHLVGRTAGAGRLSMMVRDPSGVDHLFVIKLVTGGRSSPDMVIVRDNSANIMAVRTHERNPIVAIQKGMMIAAGQGRLMRGSDLWLAIETFNNLVAQGVSSAAAAQQSGVDLAVIKQLLQLGNAAPSPNHPAPLPNPPAALPVPPSPIPKAPSGEEGFVKLPKPPAIDKVAVEPKPVKEESRKSAEKAVEIAAPDFSKRFVVSQNAPKPPKARKVKEPKRKKIRLAPLPPSEVTVTNPFIMAAAAPVEASPKPAPAAKPSSKSVSKVASKPTPEPNRSESVSKEPPSLKKPEPVSNHAIANGLVRGLLSPKNKIARRGSYKYQKIQDVVWLLRKGKSLEMACRRANIPIGSAQKILNYGGIDLSGVGGES